MTDASAKIRTLSLFSGAGGLDIGFHAAGFEVVGAVEIEPAYAATLSANSGNERFFGHHISVHCEDIREFDPTPYADAGIELVIGGPPCQTFSAAGRRSGGVLGTDDERGQLFRAYISVLNVVKPKAFVFENVYGLPGANGGGPWNEILDSFREAGYSVAFEVLDAADFGAPQHRERLIMVGSKEGQFRFPMPTHGADSASGLPFLSAIEALDGLNDADEPYHSGPAGMYGHLLPSVPEGMNYSFFTREMGHPAPLFAWRSKFHDFLYKAARDEPVRTIKSKPGKFTGPFHWKNRHFTSDELKRLQSFPDEYVIVGSYNKVVEQIGNSVPPALARAVAISVRNQIFDDYSLGSIELRDENFASTFRQRQRLRNKKFHEIARVAIGAAGYAESDPSVALSASSTYFARFQTSLAREFSDEPLEREADELEFEVHTVRRGGELDVFATPLGVVAEGGGEVEIVINGLEKYMDTLDVVRVRGRLRSVAELVSLWVVIEKELVSRSRFFTLIDIYGHYANRGDTVGVSTKLSGFEENSLVSLIERIGNSNFCGTVQSPEISKSVGLTRSIVDRLRTMRWDVRTRETHATLAPGVVLCTYPFPSISQKAQFDRALLSA